MSSAHNDDKHHDPGDIPKPWQVSTPNVGVSKPYLIAASIMRKVPAFLLPKHLQPISDGFLEGSALPKSDAHSYLVLLINSSPLTPHVLSPLQEQPSC